MKAPKEYERLNMQYVQVAFWERTCCVFMIPASIKDKEKIQDYILEKISKNENPSVERYVDYEIEKFEILED